MRYPSSLKMRSTCKDRALGIQKWWPLDVKLKALSPKISTAVNVPLNEHMYLFLVVHFL